MAGRLCSTKEFPAPLFYLVEGKDSLSYTSNTTTTGDMGLLPDM